MSDIKILVFGNPLVEKDSIALKIAGALSKKTKAEFIECDAVDDLETFGPDLVILDPAVGIKKVELITKLSALEKTRPYSMHDFDLAITLKLLKKIGKIRTVKIIAIPVNYDEKSAAKEVKQIISILSSKSA